MVIALNQIVDTYTKYFDKVKWIFAACLVVLLIILLIHILVSGRKRNSPDASDASEKSEKSLHFKSSLKVISLTGLLYTITVSIKTLLALV